MAEQAAGAGRGTGQGISAEAFQDRSVAAFLGLAVGDAWGRPLEFVHLPRVRTLAVSVAAGEFLWTDDTHMSLYLARAILDCPAEGWSAEAFGDALSRRWVEWLHDPLTFSTAPGNTCLAGARAIERGTPWQSSGVRSSDGCGAVMRIVPLGIALSGEALIEAARVSALTTHAHPNALEAAIAGAWILRRLLEGGDLSPALVGAARDLLERLALGGDVARSLDEALEQAARPELEWLDEDGLWPGDGGWRSGSALGLALVAALRWGDDLARCVEKAARIGGDSDSVACIAGMFVGAARGQRCLPEAWIAVLPRREEIAQLARDLAARGMPGAPAQRARTSGTDPIQVAWLPDRWAGRIGLTFAPGKRSGSVFGDPWARDLAADLDRLRDTCALDALAPLIEDHELASLQIPRLVEEAEARGIAVLRLPIPDGGTPDPQAARALVATLRALARAGRRVVVHCRGGLGRAGTLAACCLVADGLPPAEAIAAVRRVRPGAVENEAQERFVMGFSG